LKIRRVVWFGDIVEKLVQKHDVSQNEVRDVLEGKPCFRLIEKGHRAGENVYAAMGQTHAGRHLIVFFVYKKDGSVIILSARNMTKAERRRYEQK
jgi:uncharacterized DUF497 family protein